MIAKPEEWKRDFEALRVKHELIWQAKYSNYIKSQNSIIAGIYSIQGNITAASLVGVFQTTDITAFFKEFYANVGLSFARWYARNNTKYFEKSYLKKINLTYKATTLNDIEDLDDIWRAYMSDAGLIASQIGGLGISDTAKKLSIRVLRALVGDPVFQSATSTVRARMYAMKMNTYADYIARRIVITEMTNVSNQAVMRSATDIYRGQEMQKEWMTFMDGRARDAHEKANGNIVDFNEYFLVGGEKMMRPGDSSYASAGNIINCRCSVSPFPKPDADPIGPLESFGVGVT